MTLYDKLLKKETKVSLIGLGYVGLPIALAFGKKVPVIGFDIKPERVEMMKNHIDPSEELKPEAFDGCDILFTSNPVDLKDATFHIVAVPTPIDDSNMPDLSPLIAATKTVAKILKKGDYVVYESTVYPGATEEDCIPLLEEISGLKYIEDFKVGYSPERINPGDEVHTLATITKVVSACDDESLDIVAKTYELVVDAGVHKAPSIKVAEAAKKEDVSDIRNSRVPDIVNELKSYGVQVDVVDPYANSGEVEKEYGFGLTDDLSEKYEAVIVAVNHQEYKNLDENYFKQITSENGILVDVKGVYRNKIKDLIYWSL
ncbi:MAG: UDP-N-acetyl-D-galactosamine dehydrogenase [Bacteroidetes bacterium 4572_114]|nr:MAG: UDP-N-acetyl-D-galactosamine dehydrogenase [Bacteroidetes bacterium 4572_114]